MPVLSDPRPADRSVPAPVATPEAGPRRRTLDQVRLALALVADDPLARGLRAQDPRRPDHESPLAGWLYGRWWCGLDSSGQVVGAAEADGAAGDGAAGSDGAEAGAARLEAARRIAAGVRTRHLVLAAAGESVLTVPLDREDGRPPERLRTTLDAVLGSSRPGRPARPGDLVSLVGGESSLESGGWWWAHADRASALAGIDLDRWYLHVRDLAAAVALVPLLLGLAADVASPLSLKCLPGVSGYGRRDAAVAYLPRRLAAEAVRAARARAEALAPLLHPTVPPFTEPLLPGLGRAEDPGSEGAISYGQLRCGQVAAVAVRLSGREPARVDDAELEVALRDVGVDADRPTVVQP